MRIVSNEQWSGWFSGMGGGGVILQNVITAITPFAIAGLAIYFVYHIWQIGTSLSRADGPEQRKEAKIKLGLLILSLICTVVGPTLILILMNTIGKTTQTTLTDSKTQKEFAYQVLLNLNILKLTL